MRPSGLAIDSSRQRLKRGEISTCAAGINGGLAPVFSNCGVPLIRQAAASVVGYRLTVRWRGRMSEVNRPPWLPAMEGSKLTGLESPAQVGRG